MRIFIEDFINFIVVQMELNNFTRWIKTETGKALRVEDLNRVRILLTWYELKFKDHFNKEFEYPFTAELLVYHRSSMNRSWLNGLIDEEISTGELVTIELLAEENTKFLRDCFLIIDPNSSEKFELLIKNISVPINIVEGFKCPDKSSNFFEEKNIKLNSTLSQLKNVANFFKILEEEASDFSTVVLIGKMDLLVDLYFAFSLLLRDRKVNIRFTVDEGKDWEWESLIHKIDIFNSRYGVANYSRNVFFPYGLKELDYRVDDPKVAENPDILKSVEEIFSQKFRGIPLYRTPYSVNVNKESVPDESTINVSVENLIKQQLMFSDETVNEEIKEAILALSKEMFILILGETGVGKSHIAQTIHQLSDRKDKPFVKVNCATIPESLLSSELFGAVPGAYTGIAKEGMVGKIEAAEGGTLFLDEIFEADSSIQTKLLTFLDDRKYIKVGGHETTKANIRIIFATNRKISEFRKHPGFREDFYQRISSYVVKIPPLRNRPNDLMHLFNQFFSTFVKRFNYGSLDLAPDAIRVVENLRWPGNIREMINIIQRVIIHCENTQRSVVTGDMILRKYYDKKSDIKLDELELMLEEYFLIWERERGRIVNYFKSSGEFEDPEKISNFLDGLIMPLIANFFIEKYDKKYNRKDVHKVIGMNAERLDSPLAMKAKIYPHIKRYFSEMYT